ncbi:hypothetical protein HDU79_004630 [Rhizoclosmatium sp. JEL0117]|nr:hypothetical protein HDU79_004630 [Rhizoclosmatium sp. JEL0117]
METGTPPLLSHVLIAEYGPQQPVPSVKFQYPNANLGQTHSDAGPLMVPIPGVLLRNEDAYSFILNPKSVQSGSTILTETVVPKLKRYSSDVQIALYADAFGFDGRAWKPLSSSRTVIQCSKTKVSIWDEPCLRTFAELTDAANSEYRQPEKNCVVLYIDRLILGLRFFNESDEVTFVNHLNANFGLHQNYSPSRQIPPPMPRDPLAPLPPLYAINYVRKAGDKTRALALVSPFPWIHAFLPLVKSALDTFMRGEKIAVITSLFQTINQIDIATVPRFTIPEKIVMRSIYDPADTFYEYARAQVEIGKKRGGKNVGAIGDDWDGTTFVVNTRFNDIAYRVPVPLNVYPEEIGEFSITRLVITFSALDSINPPDIPELKWRNAAPYFWHPHLDSGWSTHPIVFLMNAVISEKRVVFVGNGRSVADIASFVHAAAAAGTGGGNVLAGALGRCFANVGIKDFKGLQAVPGFIAGTTDPSIEDRPELYDVLCDINTGKITLSQRIAPASTEGLNNRNDPTEGVADMEWMRQGYWVGDSEFMLRVVEAIQNETSEFQIRQMVYDYVQRFVDVTAAFEVEIANTTLIGRPSVPQVYPGIESGVFFHDETAQNAELVMLRNRIEGWKGTQSYFKYLQSHNENLQKTYLPSTFPLSSMIDQIYKAQPVTPTPVLVQILQYIQDTILPGPDAAQTELLAALRSRGIQLFAAGMMHERWEVRRACTRVLWRLDWHPIGTNFIQNLNPFYRLCYARTSHLLLSQEDEPNIDPPPSSAPLDATAPIPPPRSSKRTTKSNSTRMSMLLLDEKNASRTNFNNVKQGYRASILGKVPGSVADLAPGSPRVPGGGLRPSGSLQKVPGWIQDDNGSIRSGRSGRGSKAGPIQTSKNNTDMSDLDKMYKNVERLGFQSQQAGRGTGGGGYQPSSRQIAHSYASSDDEDADDMERGRAAGGGLGRGPSGENLAQGGRGGMSPRGPASLGQQPMSPQQPRSTSAGPPGRVPRGASAGGPPQGVVQLQQVQQAQQLGRSPRNISAQQGPQAGQRGPR